jgi:hypothetical protein
MVAELKADVVAFVDDSITDVGITVGAVVVPIERVAEAEAAVAAAKLKVEVPAEEPIHCRVIFSGHGRRGTPWEKVSPENIEQTVVGICRQLQPITLQPVVCRIDRGAIPPGVSGEGSIFKGLEAKGVASFAYTAVLGRLTDKLGKPVRAFMDPDTTKIPWGESRRQADRTRSVFIDLIPGEEPLQVEPVIEKSPKPLLLQVADIYAYLAVHAFDPSGGRRNAWCQELYRSLGTDDLVFEFANTTPRWTPIAKP